MERLFYTDYDVSDNLLMIEGDEFKHARALRLGVGSEFIGLSGDGLELRCRVREIGEGELTAEVEMHRRYGGEPPLNITIAQAFLKKGLLREALSMAIQAGISGFIPLISERVIGKREGFEGFNSSLRNVARA
jgi:RsmE family RNA methyltransferase